MSALAFSLPFKVFLMYNIRACANKVALESNVSFVDSERCKIYYYSVFREFFGGA
jgi:hypothetical protein